MSAVNYCLELPTQWSIHPVFHIDLLTPYKETTMHGPNFTRPTPELIDGEEEYSVEKILDSRHFGRRRRLQYLVKWEGYPDADNMWVDKDDVFADDKVWEFKNSNPDAATHIRNISFTKSPYPPTLTRSQLLYHHALSCMSSNGNDDLTYEYPTGAVADSPIPFSSEVAVDTPVSVPVPIIDFTTLQPVNTAAAIFSPRPVTASSSASDVTAMFRQLRVHTPAPLTPDGQRAADQANETFTVSFTPAKGEGVRQALAWNREQLVDLRHLWELRQQRCFDQGLIPMTCLPMMISDTALAVGNNENTAMGTPLLSQTPHSISPLTPLESHCQDPFRPTAWRDLTSGVRRPRRWQLASSPASSKTTKIPLRFRQPTTTGKNSRESLQRDLASCLTLLPKGWVYATEEVDAAVKAEVTDPSKYLMPDAPLTHSQLKSVSQQDDPHRRHWRASSITKAPPSSLSASATNTAVKCRRVISGLTSTLQTPLWRGVCLLTGPPITVRSMPPPSTTLMFRPLPLLLTY
jgi:hypothetical protein